MFEIASRKFGWKDPLLLTGCLLVNCILFFKALEEESTHLKIGSMALQ